MQEIEKNQSRKRIWLVIVLAIFCLSSGIYVGRVWEIKQSISGKGSVDITKVIELYSKSRSTEVSFEQFWNVWNKVKEKYVEQPVNDTDLFYGAVEGMVAGLNDPYSVYFPPKKATEFANDLSGKLEGIGAEIGIKEKQLIIIAPLPKSPAESAGLKAGDKIYAIDKQETSSLTVDEAVSKIRGPEGTEVTLTISHNGLTSVQDIKIKRAKITIPSVAWEMKENNLAYLRISYFNDNTWVEFDKIVNEILLKLPKGVILDLRSNPGGYLDTSVDVASEWVKEGVIVKEKFSSTKENTYQTSGTHRFLNIPTIILVDEGTASGSEIVAGALQDYGLAKLVGAKTYGKGSVQDFEVLPDGSALKITVAKWYTPKDRQISKLGIIPDVILDKMVEEIKDAKGNITYKDLGLEKAIELLK